MRFSVIAFIALTATISNSGCGKKSEKIAVHPVSGQIFYAGKPAEGIQVFLKPTTAPAMPLIPANPRGITGADGWFRITTHGNDDGAAPGGYQVLLLWPPPPKDGRNETDSDRLLGWYGPANSKLNIEVKEGDNVLPPFRLNATFQPAP